MPDDRTDRTDRPDRNSPSSSDTARTNRDSRGPRNEQLDGRSLAGASYGATEREQTRDLRRADPGDPSSVADEANSADVANDDTGE
jgi:hypothetical protein